MVNLNGRLEQKKENFFPPAIIKAVWFSLIISTAALLAPMLFFKAYFTTIKNIFNYYIRGKGIRPTLGAGLFAVTGPTILATVAAIAIVVAVPVCFGAAFFLVFSAIADNLMSEHPAKPSFPNFSDNYFTTTRQSSRVIPSAPSFPPREAPHRQATTENQQQSNGRGENISPPAFNMIPNFPPPSYEQATAQKSPSSLVY